MVQIIHLNDAEVRLADYVAKKRYSMNRELSNGDKKIGPQSVEETDRESMGAEIAFHKLFNTYPDLETTPKTQHHPHEDAFLHIGLSVDAKQTIYSNGRLLAPIWKKKIAADIYALMVGKIPEYRFVGLVSADELFKDENIIDLGHGPTYALNQDKLHNRKRG